MTARIHCFPPVMDGRTQVLILGSLPGVSSLAKKEYYANSANQFWRLLGTALGISFLARFSYANRLRLVQHLGIGIWSSLKSGEREGSSLDAKIRDIKPVDFLRTLVDSDAADSVKAVLFDGRLAQTVFMKEIFWGLPSYYQRTIDFSYLPSSSPAYARMRFQEKSRLWTFRIREHLSCFSEKREIEDDK
jgi:hypoxanthine-DNA glycosylase